MEIIDITNSKENIFNFLTQIIKDKELLLEGKILHYPNVF